LKNVTVGGSNNAGVRDRRIGPGKLVISDSSIAFNTGPGVVIAPQSGTSLLALLDNVRSEANTYGIAVGSGNRVMIRNSVFSENSAAGVEGDPGAQIVVDNSTVSHNNVGVQSNSSVRLSNNNIAFNNTAITGPSGTFGNNRFSANSAIGTAPTALGAATHDLGQQ